MDKNNNLQTKNDQIIRETFQKLAQVILQARIVFPITPPAQKRINKWFNLEIEELDSITRDMISWQGNLHAPLFIEVYFSSHEPLHHPDYTPLMERWKIVYQSNIGTTSIEIPTVYKHLVLLVRGVAGLLRVMPAFRAFRNCQQRARALGGGGGVSSGSSGADIRYSFHASFPSSREFSSSRATTEFTFDPVISPFGSLTVSVVYRNDCSVEIGATDPIIKAHFINDYSPSEYSSTSPPKKIYSQESTPYRSAPIGIPGKDTVSEALMPLVSSPPSSLTMMSPGYLTEPLTFPYHQGTPPSNPPFRPNSLPNQYPFVTNPTSTSPVGIPISTSGRAAMYPFSSSPTNSNTSGYGHTGSGTNFNHHPLTFNTSTSTTSASSTSTSNSSGSAGNSSNPNINVNTSGKLRPRAASYVPPSITSLVSPPSTVSPLSSTPPYSGTGYPRLPYSTSPSKDPYSTSPTTYIPSPTSSASSPPVTSTSPNTASSQRPATNMYMSTLLGPSIHLTSPPIHPYELPAITEAFDELAFAADEQQTSKTSEVERQIEEMGMMAKGEAGVGVGGAGVGIGDVGDIGHFIRMCKSAPPLKMFSSPPPPTPSSSSPSSPPQKRIVGSSFLFADMTTSQIKNQLLYFSLTESH